MLPKLTDDQRAALKSRPAGQPVQIEDELEHKLYWLISQEDLRLLWSEYVDRELDRGIDAIERGELKEWNPDRLKQRISEVNRNRESN